MSGLTTFSSRFSVIGFFCCLGCAVLFFTGKVDSNNIAGVGWLVAAWGQIFYAVDKW